MSAPAPFHTVHLYVPLPEPLDLPTGFGIQWLEAPGTYTGESFRLWDATTLTTDDLTAGPLCRFFPQQVPVELGRIDAVVDLAKRLGSNIAGEHPAEVSTLTAPAGQIGEPEGDPVAPSKIQTAVEIVYPIACPNNEHSSHTVDEFVESALAVGLHLIQVVQKSVYAITRQPYTLITSQLLPFLIPVSVSSLNETGVKNPEIYELMQVNRNLLSELPPAEVSNEQLGTMTTLVNSVESRTFFGYLDFQREALVAYTTRGDNRSAAIFLGLACERFLDDLLSHLMWEEGMRPEDAPGTFFDQGGITGRVRREFHPRLKGNWSTESPGPVADWWQKVAKVRNQVVHGAYLPTNEEIESANKAAIALVTYTSDCLAERIREEGKFRLTALALMAEPGMRRRNLWTRRSQEVAQRFDNEDLWSRASRWKAAAERQRARSFGDDPKPSASRSYTMFVVRGSASSYWLQHDRRCAQARLIREPGSLPLAQRNSLATFERVVRETMTADDTPESIVIELVDQEAVEVVRDWSEEYQLVPRAEVMVDGSDLDSIP